MHRLILPLLASALLYAALASIATGQSADVLAEGRIDSSFENWTGSTFTGWNLTGATFAGAGLVHADTGAAHLEASGSGTIVLSTQHWLVAAIEGTEYTLNAFVYENDSSINGLTIELELTDFPGTKVDSSVSASLLSEAAAYQQLTTGTLTASAGGLYVRVTIRASATAVGATFHVNSVTVEASVPPPPTPTPTPSPSPTASPTPSPTPTATPSPTPSPAPSAPVATASPTPTAVISEQLVNGDFSAGIDGWAKVGGTLATGSGFSDSGLAAVLTSQSGSTKWIHQTVLVTGGAWYELSARLRAANPADEFLIRIAWYASADGGGSQLSTASSPLIRASTPALVDATTGVVRAPLAARSAKVRLMLRPASGAFTVLVADDVRFEAVRAPEATATPAASPTPIASPTPTATATSTVTPTPTPSPAPASTATPVATATAFAAAPTPTVIVAAGPPPAEQRGGSDVAASIAAGPAALVRITELMPDPPEPGRDADYEWVELANVGTVEVSLDGYTLRDNSGEVALPNFSLPPGAVLVIAAPLASVEGAVAYRLTGAIGNGLANGGDRLALFDADGARVDALSYGSDRTYLAEGEAPLPAPGAGRSLRRDFADDGSLISAGVSDEPSPGRLPDPPAAEPESERARRSAERGTTNRAAWMVLLVIATAALATAGGLRLRELLRDEDG